MKFLFAITHLNFWSPLDPVARMFFEKGHLVRVLINKSANRKFEGRYVLEKKSVPYKMDWMTPRRDVFGYLQRSTREIISYIAYLKLRQPTSQLLIDRWAGYMPLPLQLLSRNRKLRNWMSGDIVWERLWRLEPRVPPSDRLLHEIQAFRPDVLVAASAIMPFSQELEYLKAANILRIPTIVVVPSWDNLTTKGTLQIIPNWLFVWNKSQVPEAIKLHFVPEEHIFCTGAPRYDLWFDRKPTIKRRPFCNQIGIDPNKPYILYICSSEFIAEDEPVFINQLADCVAKNPLLKDFTILVRPHPQNLKPWERYQNTKENISLWPNSLFSMNPSNTVNEFFHAIFYSIGVVGINTSAFIEAAIVDRPCIAIASNQFELTQLGIPHFHHLLDADFLELPRNFEETAHVIADILKGKDQKMGKRLEFVNNFIRPNGLDISATKVMARAIENVARGRHPGNQNKTDEE